MGHSLVEIVEIEEVFSGEILAVLAQDIKAYPLSLSQGLNLFFGQGKDLFDDKNPFQPLQKRKDCLFWEGIDLFQTEDFDPV
jgi:hypothetical protein